MTLDPKLASALAGVSTATLTTVLLKQGLRNVWMRGTRPLRPDQPRLVGRAFTLSLRAGARGPGHAGLLGLAEIDAGGHRGHAGRLHRRGRRAGITDAGIFGDILCARMAKRGVAGLVTDGVVRDLAGVLGTGLPVWCQGAAAPPSVAGLTFVDWQQPIGCGGVAVFPDDVVVVDADGAVVVPAALVESVAAASVEQERLETWIMGEVEGGAALPGLYPPNDAHKARYEASKRGK